VRPVARLLAEDSIGPTGNCVFFGEKSPVPPEVTTASPGESWSRRREVDQAELDGGFRDPNGLPASANDGTSSTWR
jgi:hypothetical protein